MHRHLLRLVIVQFFPNMSLVLGRQPGPGLVCSPVVLVGRGNFNVVIELNNLKRETIRLSNNFSDSSHCNEDPVSEIKVELTFLFLSSSTVGLKLSFRSRYRFFSSRSFFIASLSISKMRFRC